MKELMNIISNVNDTMKKFGFNEKIVVGNDNINVSEKEVIINMPYTLKLTIPKEKFESKEPNAIKDAVSQAISQAISHPVSVNK